MCICSARLTAGNETWRRWLDIRVLVFVVRSPTCARFLPLLTVCLRVPFSVAVGHRRDRRPRTLARSAPPSPIRLPSPHIWQMSARRKERLPARSERPTRDSLRRFISTTRHFPAPLTMLLPSGLGLFFGPTDADEGVQFTEQTQILLWGQILLQRFSGNAFLSITSGSQR